MSDPVWPLFDADNHFYEPLDAFTRFRDPKLRSSRAIRWVQQDNGKPQLVIGDRVFRFIPNPTMEPVADPGILQTMFKRVHDGETIGADETWGGFGPMRPAFINRDARLACMDEQGVEAAFMIPTLALTIEPEMVHDVEMTYANLHAFNRWLEEDWGFNHGNRIYAGPMISLLDLDLAVSELDWALARGARTIHIQPGPVNHRSPADPVFDPFWARVNEAGIVVLYHGEASGYNKLFSPFWGEPTDVPFDKLSAFQWALCSDRPIIDTMLALVLQGLFVRFPNIRVVTIESGFAWVPYVLGWLHKAPSLGRRGGRLPEPAQDIFRRHVYVQPFPEDDLRQLVDLVGADHVLMGSDWPHPEGLAEPRDYLPALQHFDDAQVRMITRDNAMSLVAG